MQDAQSRETVFKLAGSHIEASAAWAILSFLHCLSSLSCTHEYVAIDNGGNT